MVFLIYKNNTISWEKFKGTLYDSLGESKAQHILSTLPPEIRAQHDATFSDGPTSHSAKAEKPLTRRSSKKQLVHSTDATTLPTTPRQRKRRGSNTNRSATPSSSASDDTVSPSPEKKQKLSSSQPGVPTKARTAALPSSPPSQPAVVTHAPTSSAGGNNNHNNGAQPLPPEMLLAQLSTYRPSSGPASPTTSESAGGGGGGNGGTARPSSPPVVTLSPTPRSAADAAPPTNRWYWKNDDEWEPYSDDICRELERAYSLHTVCYIILEVPIPSPPLRFQSTCVYPLSLRRMFPTRWISEQWCKYEWTLQSVGVTYGGTECGNLLFVLGLFCKICEGALC